MFTDSKGSPFFEVFFDHFKNFDGGCYTTASGVFFQNGRTIKGIDSRYSNLSFSSRLKILLKSINEDFVLFFLDDFFLLDDIDEKLIEDAIKLLNDNKKIAAAQLKDVLSSKDICVKKIDDFFSLRNNRTPYICTTQVTLWRRKELIKILRDGESPWDFEIIGSYRLRSFNKMIIYRNDECSSCINYPIGGIIHRGKVIQEFDAFKSYEFFSDISGINFGNTSKTTNVVSQHVPVLFGHHISPKNFLNYIYPFISKIFPFVHRFGRGYPKYVTKHLTF